MTQRLLALPLLLLGILTAQPPPQPLTFDVASIRPSTADGRDRRFEITPNNGLRATGATLRLLIQKAWDVEDFQIAGGPAWAGTERFDIVAVPDKPAAADPDAAQHFRERLRSLLADRFRLSVREEVKQGALYELEQAKGGSRLKPSTGGRGIGRNRGLITAEGESAAVLAHALSASLRQPVIDKTGLTGLYAFRLEWAEEGAPGEPVDNGVSLFTAIQEQLGLRLLSTRGPITFISIQSAEKPSAN